MADPLATVPAHLRRFVVEQDYAQYTAVDQAVWRFVLVNTRARLMETAHPAYREGLAATGISVERIPSIAEMNEHLGRFGWGAVCVDGFIPPRAFQEFQSRGLLPIAADMRTREHLVYTPAPDIIHEAAGHAPILPDPTYATYLRRIGEIGKRAFTIPEEDRIFQAIYALSEIKEDVTKGPESVARVEAELAAALGAVSEVSEATWLSRLYWWTAEYGLVGTPRDYLLYGAGLISSLGESHSCHAPAVKKLRFDERCIHVGYDVTRPQPQLFVTPDFETLHGVLDRVSAELASELGGGVAVERAIRSRELASFRFSSGAWAIGTLLAAGPNPFEPAWLKLRGPVAYAWDGVIPGTERPITARPISDPRPSSSPPEVPSEETARPAHDGGELPAEQFILTGTLAGGIELHALTDATLHQLFALGTGRHHLLFTSGAAVEGRLVRTQRDAKGRLRQLHFRDVRLTLPGSAVLALSEFVLLAAGNFIGAEAGAIDARYHPDTSFSGVRVPKPRPRTESEAVLISLYDAAARVRRGDDPGAGEELRRIHDVLARDFPAEWLLRWNLLEAALRRLGDTGLAGTLREELERLEIRFEGKEPIATGLRYLGSRAQ